MESTTGNNTQESLVDPAPETNNATMENIEEEMNQSIMDDKTLDQVNIENQKSYEANEIAPDQQKEEHNSANQFPEDLNQKGEWTDQQQTLSRSQAAKLGTNSSGSRTSRSTSKSHSSSNARMQA